MKFLAKDLNQKPSKMEKKVRDIIFGNNTAPHPQIPITKTGKCECCV